VHIRVILVVIYISDLLVEDFFERTKKNPM